MQIFLIIVGVGMLRIIRLVGAEITMMEFINFWRNKVMRNQKFIAKNMMSNMNYMMMRNMIRNLMK